MINLAGTTGGGIITQSGAGGHLKFISALTAAGVGAKNLTLSGSTAGTGEIAGAIIDNAAANPTSLSKEGTGKWTLSGVNTYTGPTSVNGGTLALGAGGSLGASPVTVNSGGVFGAQPGSDIFTTMGGSLTMNAGSAYSGVDGFNSTLTVAGSADLYAGAAGVAPAYSFNLSGASGISDALAVTGAASFTNPGAVVSFVPTAPLTNGDVYTFATAASGLDAANTWSLASGGRASFGNTAYLLSLTNTATSSAVTVTGSGAAFAYYTGDKGATLGANTAGDTNWATDLTGAADAATQPNNLTDVYFGATGAANLSITSLGQSYTVNSLNFNGDAGAVTISDSGANTLTVNGGLNVAAAAPAPAINAPVILGGSQTWVNDSATGVLTIGAPLARGANSLTLAGTGSTTFGGGIAGTGGLAINSAGATTISGGIAGAASLTLSGTGNTTINGGLTGGAVAITKGGSGVLSLTGGNTNTGAIAVNAGVVVLSGNNSGATGGITVAPGATLRAVGSASTFPTGSVSLNSINTSSAILELRADAATNFAKDISMAGVNATNTTNVIHTIIVDNAGGGGSGSGLNHAISGILSPTPVAAQARQLTVSSPNGYGLEIGSLELAGLTGRITIVDAQTRVIIGAVTNPMTGFAAANFDTLTLQGSSADSEVTGAIANAAGGSLTAGGYTALTKAGSGS